MIKRKAFLLLVLFSLFSCTNSDEGIINCIPNSIVNVVLNLTLPQNLPLQNPNGFVVVTSQSAGSRGLIVVNTGNGFRAFDRNAPHLCPGEDTTLQVEDGTRIVCPADGAEFFLTTGQPISISDRALISYPVNRSGNNLIISN